MHTFDDFYADMELMHLFLEKHVRRLGSNTNVPESELREQILEMMRPTKRMMSVLATELTAEEQALQLSDARIIEIAALAEVEPAEIDCLIQLFNTYSNPNVREKFFSRFSRDLQSERRMNMIFILAVVFIGLLLTGLAIMARVTPVDVR